MLQKISIFNWEATQFNISNVPLTRPQITERGSGSDQKVMKIKEKWSEAPSSIGSIKI